MRVKAYSTFNLEADSEEAGKLAALHIGESFAPARPSLLLVYGTINHEQTKLLGGIRKLVGPEPILLGCSAQGVVANGQLTEEGYGIGIMGFGGSELVAVAAHEREIQQNPREKGRSLAEQLRAQLNRNPEVVFMVYDPSCGANIQEILAEMGSLLACPLVGGGASVSWGLPTSTYQYFGNEALQRSAVAFALAGPFGVEVGLCHGTSPTGVVMTVTRVQGNGILELDGRPALEVFREVSGHVQGELVQQEHLVCWGVGVERMTTVLGPNGPEQRPTYLIRAAVGIDNMTGAVKVQSGFPEGTRIAFFHRETEAVLNGTKAMGQDLARRIRGKRAWAALGFECRARTVPFLGAEQTLAEHADLCRSLGSELPWLGMMAWGEIAPCGNEPAFHNYTYPLAVLVEAS